MSVISSLPSPSLKAGERLSARTLAAYSAPAFAFAVPTIPIYIYLPAVYADELGMGLAATGTAILIARVLDTLSDPVVGLLSDRTPTGFGLRKPWMIFGAAVAAVGMLLTAFPPATPGIAFLTCSLVVLLAGSTAVSVPYNAWGAELDTSYNGRTRLTSTREGLALGGILFASLLPTFIAGTSSDRFRWVALTAIVSGAAGIAAIALLVPDKTLRRDGGNEHPTAFDIRTLMSEMAGNLPFLRLVAAWFINGLANGLPAALFILYLTYGLGADSRMQPLFVLTYFLAAVVALPAVYALSVKIGKHRAWCFSMIAACAAFALVPLLEAGQFGLFFGVCAVTGAALGADLILPPALQADVIDLDRLRFRKQRTGTYFAVWSAAAKSATAIAGGLGLIAVGAAGFDPAAVDAPGVTALVLAYSVVPIALKAAAIALLWSFPITMQRHAIIRRRLDSLSTRRAPIRPSAS